MSMHVLVHACVLIYIRGFVVKLLTHESSFGLRRLCDEINLYLYMKKTNQNEANAE